MKPRAITPLLLGLLLPACPSDPARLTLWLAPNVVEYKVKLIEQEPDPF
jgi:hypothetical protein